jgi:hypothetical protein
MDEATFWSDRLRPMLVKQCQALRLRHHFERVENYVAEGTPDVDYCIAGFAGKIELKYGTGGVRQSTPVLGRGHGLRRSQIIFASRRTWAGGAVWCIIGSPDKTWAIDLRGMDPEAMDALATYNPSQLDAVAAWHTVHPLGATLPLALVDDPQWRELAKGLKLVSG